jgi:DNA-binding GntR family transcriptional regulator
MLISMTDIIVDNIQSKIDLGDVQSTKRKRKVSVAEQVAEGLSALIEGRVYLPGDRLREQEIAERFQVSRGPVREALRILEAKSLVHIEAMRGATVSRLSDQEAREAVEISAVLFGLAARRAAGRLSPDNFAEIMREYDLLAQMVDTEATSKDFFAQTLKMGRLIVEGEGSKRLRQMILEVRLGAPNVYGSLGFVTPSGRALAAGKWRSLLLALRDGQSDVAERFAKEVHDDALKAVMSVLGT